MLECGVITFAGRHCAPVSQLGDVELRARHGGLGKAPQRAQLAAERRGQHRLALRGHRPRLYDDAAGTRPFWELQFSANANAPPR